MKYRRFGGQPNVAAAMTGVSQPAQVDETAQASWRDVSRSRSETAEQITGNATSGSE
jgi:hypothetical protein